MTVPFKYPDFAPASQTGEAEWQVFQRRQQQLLDSIATHTALENAKTQQAGGVAPNGMLMPSQEFLNNMAPSEGPVAGAGRSFDTNFDTGQPRGGMSTGDYEHLLHAAHWWNIESPESMNPQALAAEVKKKEIGFQGERGYQTHLSDIPTEVTAFTTAAASGLANTMANVVGDVKELPFVGDNLAKLVNSEKGVEWLRRLGRNIGSVAYGMGQALPTDWDNGSFAAIRATGEFGGEAVPAYFAWEAIGAAGGVSALGKLGGRLTAFQRAEMVGVRGLQGVGTAKRLTAFQRAGIVAVRGLQGVGTAMLLEAGSNKSQEEKNQAYVAGGLLAGALESAGQALAPVLGRVIPRIRSALGIPQVMEGPRMDGFGPAYTEAPAGSSVLRTAEENADWSFIDDSPLPPRGGPGLPPGGGGGTPLLTAPVEGPGTGLPAAREPLGLPQRRAPLALPRPANPSDVVEATYGGEDVPLRIVSPALRRTPYGATTAQIEPLNPAVAGDQITIQNYMVQNHPAFGYVDEAGRFLTPYEAASQLSQMTERELAFLHGSFMEAPPPVEPPTLPDYGSQRFLEGKPSQGPSSSVLALTKIRHPETGMPERMYHGTGRVYDQPKTFDAPSNPEHQLFGPGYYTTNNPEIASGYPPELSESDIQYYTDYLARLRDQQKSFLAKDPSMIRSLQNIYGIDDLNGIAQRLQDDINYNSGELDRLSSIRPNVRPQYLDIRNPFDIDAPYTEDHVNAIALAMQKNRVPDTAIQAFIQHAMDPMSVVDYMDDASRMSLGEGLYEMLVAQSHNDPGVGIPAGGWTLLPTDVDPNSLNSFNQPTMQIGKALANKILEDAGFDGITHIGGGRTGNDPHRVAIAFRASQVHPAYEPTVLESLEAERLAAQMNRQQIVMDSPDLPELAGKPALNDGDVAEAAVRANPGGVTIIKSVGMPADVMEGLKSGDVRFALTKRGNLDALVGEVTPEMARDYQDYGMFKGQRALLASGREVTIVEPGIEHVKIMDHMAGIEIYVPAEVVSPGRSGMEIVEAPAEWDEFRQNVLEYANEEARKAGMQPVEDMRDYRVASILQNRIDQHLEYFSPAEKQVMQKYFEQRWAREFRDAVPADSELESLASIMANEAYAESVTSASPHEPVSLVEGTAPKGIWPSPLVDEPNLTVPDLEQKIAELVAIQDEARANGALEGAYDNQQSRIWSKAGDQLSKYQQQLRMIEYGMPESELAKFASMSDEELMREVVARNTKRDFAWDDETAPKRNRAEAEQLMHVQEWRKRNNPAEMQARTIEAAADRYSWRAQQLRESVNSGDVDQLTGDTYSSLMGVAMHMSDMAERIRSGEVLSRAQMSDLERMMNYKFSDEPVPPAIEDVAESKGFVWHPNAGDGGRIEDLIGGEDLPMFSSDEAARTFLANIDRELPDLGPESDVPLEVMQHGPSSQSGSALESGPGLAGPEREIDNWMEGVEAADADYGAEDLGGGVGAGGGAGGAGGGGGRIGGPQDEPNPWMGPLGPQLGPEVPGLGQKLANKIHMFMEANPDQYALWRQQILESIVWKNRPTRYKFLAYEEHLNKIGATGNRVWDMVDNLFTALTQSHNEATPWHRRASSILAKLPRKFMRSGDFVRVHELTDPVDQERVWKIIRDRYGWSDAKYQQVRDASAEVKQFYRDLFALKSGDPRTGLTAEREIWNYIPRLRAAQAAGRFQVDGDINPLIEDFATYAREGMLQMRQMDIRDLMYHSVNATFNAKYVAEPYAELVTTWSHPGIPEEVKEPVLGLARLARYGQDMGHSAAVRGIRAAFRTLGLPINTAEASSIMNTPLAWNYKSMLGGKPYVLFRDAIQPLKAGLKVGMPKVMDIYRRAFSSPAFKAEMIDQGIKGGWVEVDRAQFEGAGLMEHTATATRNAQGEVIGSNLDMGAITRGQIARREALASVVDVIRDAIPIRLRQASETLDPLRPYAKVSGLWNRAIAGRAGWETASGAISEFRAAQRAAIFEGAEAPTMDSLMENSAAGSFEPAIRRKFQGYIDAGQDEEAANLIARQVADWSQGRYGTKETMQFNRGYTGRLVMQFGNFAPQELESVISMARNGSAAQRTKALLGYSAINAAMYAAEAYTGWRFGKWAWAQGIAFGGGPAIDPAIQAIQAARGMAATVGGSTPSPDATTAAQRYARTKPEDILAPFNPYQGVLSTVDQLVQATQGVNPVEQIARYTITGDRGGNIDWQRALEAAQRPQGHDPRYEIPPAMTKEELLRRMHQPPQQPAPPRAGAIQ